MQHRNLLVSKRTKLLGFCIVLVFCFAFGLGFFAQVQVMHMLLHRLYVQKSNAFCMLGVEVVVANILA